MSTPARPTERTSTTRRNAATVVLDPRERAPRTTAADGEDSGACTAMDRALVDVESSARNTRLFLVAGNRLAFGRSDQDPRREIRNDIVLRVLPTSDEANRAATRRISNAHGEVAITGNDATVLDRSSRGIRLDGVRIPAEQAVKLPDPFELDLADGALLLTGQIIRSRRSGAIQAVVLSRRSNACDHIYVLLVEALRVGATASGETLLGDAPAEPAGHVDFFVEDGRIAFESEGEILALTPGVCVFGARQFTIRKLEAKRFSELRSE